MEGLVLLIIAGFSLYRLFTSPFFEIKEPERQDSDYDLFRKNHPRYSIQDQIRMKTGMDYVYFYNPGVWLGEKKMEGGVSYYLFSESGELQAQALMEGSVYVDGMNKPNRLFLAVKPGLEDEKGRVVMLYGAVDDDFNIIVPPVYDEILSKEDMFAAVRKNAYWGIYNGEGIAVVPAEYDTIIQDAPYTRFFASKNAVHHIITYQGVITAELNYTRIYLKQAGAKTFIKTFIADSVDDLNVYTDVQLVPGKWGLLDQDCNALIPAKYKLLYNSPNYALVMQGELIIDRSAVCWPGMDEYYFAAGGKWGVSDFNDNMLIPASYDWIDFTESEELFLVNTGGKMFYLKTHSRKGFWGIQGGKWGLINRKNEILVPTEFDHVSQQKETLQFQKSSKISFDLTLPYQTFDVRRNSLC